MGLSVLSNLLMAQYVWNKAPLEKNGEDAQCSDLSL